jgi:membrane protein required for beta-lactamase induction
MTLAFARLPRESAKAHAAFREYLELGPQRSLALVAANLGKSKVLMERWSRRYDWAGRLAAQAAHVADIERQAIESLAIEKAVEWHRQHEGITR